MPIQLSNDSQYTKYEDEESFIICPTEGKKKTHPIT